MLSELDPKKCLQKLSGTLSKGGSDSEFPIRKVVNGNGLENWSNTELSPQGILIDYPYVLFYGSSMSPEQKYWKLPSDLKSCLNPTFFGHFIIKPQIRNPSVWNNHPCFGRSAKPVCYCCCGQEIVLINNAACHRNPAAAGNITNLQKYCSTHSSGILNVLRNEGFSSETTDPKSLSRKLVQKPHPNYSCLQHDVKSVSPQIAPQNESSAKDKNRLSDCEMGTSAYFPIKDNKAKAAMVKRGCDYIDKPISNKPEETDYPVPESQVSEVILEKHHGDEIARVRNPVIDEMDKENTSTITDSLSGSEDVMNKIPSARISVTEDPVHDVERELFSCSVNETTETTYSAVKEVSETTPKKIDNLPDCKVVIDCSEIVHIVREPEEAKFTGEHFSEETLLLESSDSEPELPSFIKNDCLHTLTKENVFRTVGVKLKDNNDDKVESDGTTNSFREKKSAPVFGGKTPRVLLRKLSEKDIQSFSPRKTNGIFEKKIKEILKKKSHPKSPCKDLLWKKTLKVALKKLTPKEIKIHSKKRKVTFSKECKVYHQEENCTENRNAPKAFNKHTMTFANIPDHLVSCLKKEKQFFPENKPEETEIAKDNHDAENAKSSRKESLLISADLVSMCPKPKRTKVADVSITSGEQKIIKNVDPEPLELSNTPYVNKSTEIKIYSSDKHKSHFSKSEASLTHKKNKHRIKKKFSISAFQMDKTDRYCYLETGKSHKPEKKKQGSDENTVQPLKTDLPKEKKRKKHHKHKHDSGTCKNDPVKNKSHRKVEKVHSTKSKSVLGTLSTENNSVPLSHHKPERKLSSDPRSQEIQSEPDLNMHIGTDSNSILTDSCNLVYSEDTMPPLENTSYNTPNISSLDLKLENTEGQDTLRSEKDHKLHESKYLEICQKLKHDKRSDNTSVVLTGSKKKETADVYSIKTISEKNHESKLANQKLDSENISEKLKPLNQQPQELVFKLCDENFFGHYDLKLENGKHTDRKINDSLDSEIDRLGCNNNNNNNLESVPILCNLKHSDNNRHIDLSGFKREAKSEDCGDLSFPNQNSESEKKKSGSTTPAMYQTQNTEYEVCQKPHLSCGDLELENIERTKVLSDFHNDRFGHNNEHLKSVPKVGDALPPGTEHIFLLDSENEESVFKKTNSKGSEVLKFQNPDFEAENENSMPPFSESQNSENTVPKLPNPVNSDVKIKRLGILNCDKEDQIFDKEPCYKEFLVNSNSDLRNNLPVINTKGSDIKHTELDSSKVRRTLDLSSITTKSETSKDKKIPSPNLEFRKNEVLKSQTKALSDCQCLFPFDENNSVLGISNIISKHNESIVSSTACTTDVGSKKMQQSFSELTTTSVKIKKMLLEAEMVSGIGKNSSLSCNSLEESKTKAGGNEGSTRLDQQKRKSKKEIDFVDTLLEHALIKKKRKPKKREKGEKWRLIEIDVSKSSYSELVLSFPENIEDPRLRSTVGQVNADAIVSKRNLQPQETTDIILKKDLELCPEYEPLNADVIFSQQESTGKTHNKDQGLFTRTRPDNTDVFGSIGNLQEQESMFKFLESNTLCEFSDSPYAEPKPSKGNVNRTFSSPDSTSLDTLIEELRFDTQLSVVDIHNDILNYMTSFDKAELDDKELQPAVVTSSSEGSAEKVESSRQTHFDQHFNCDISETGPVTSYPLEEVDLTDPDWEKYKKPSTESEQFEFIRKMWERDPSENLTKNHSVYNFRPGIKRKASDDFQPRRKTTKTVLSTFMQDKELEDNYRKFQEVFTSLKKRCLLSIHSLEKEYKLNYQTCKGKLISKSSEASNIAKMKESLDKKLKLDLEAVIQSFKTRYGQIKNSFQQEQLAVKTVREEILEFDRFCGTNHDTNLDEQEKERFLLFNDMINCYNTVYKQP